MMNVVICGGGQVGSSIASYLTQEDANVTIIDNDDAIIRRLNESMDVRAHKGHAAHPEVLKQAGAKSADMIVAVTSNDEVNMVACQVAHTLFDVPTKIARLRHQNYLDESWRDLFSANHMPIDFIISPEIEVSEAIHKRLQVPGAADVLSLGRGRVHLLGINIDEETPLINTAFKQISDLFPDLKMRIICLIREDKICLAKDELQLQPGDTVYVLVDTKHIRRAMIAFGHEEKEAHRILIAGGGGIGRRLGKVVEDISDVRAKMIELDSEKAKQVAIELPDTIVIHGDLLDTDLLEEVGIKRIETFVAVTDDDEFNIMASLLAKKHNCPRVISLLNTPVYETLTAQLGIDVVINPRALTVSSILQHIRRGRVRSVYSIGEGDAEILEVDVIKGSGFADKIVKELDLPKDVILGAIVRDKDVIFPDESTEILVNDRVVTFAPKKAVKKLEKKFLVKQRII